VREREDDIMDLTVKRKQFRKLMAHLLTATVKALLDRVQLDANGFG
jgi:hypothetical protein